MRKVAVVGIGHSKFGKRKGVTIKELSHEAITPALQDAGITAKDVDAGVIAIAGEEFAAQGCPAAAIGDYVGLTGKPVYRVEAACASGSAAVRTAWTQIASGLADIALAAGVETMTHMSTERATELMARAGDALWEYPYGVSFPAFYALTATAHMAQYGTTREQLSTVSVKNHKYGALNPYAHFYQKPVDLQTAMKSVMISHPLNLFDCCPISDGAAAVILASEEKAKQLTDTPIWIIGLGGGSDTMQISERQSLTGLLGTRRAAEQAFKMAKLEPKDIQGMNVHDCFTIAEIMAYEDLGFCKKGEGGKFAQEGQTDIGGKIPTNIDGGLKAKGHPIAATGVSMTYEATKQLRGQAEKGRQIPNLEHFLTMNCGMTGQFMFVHIYSR